MENYTNTMTTKSFENWYYDEEVVEQQLGIGSSSSGSLI